MHTHMIHIHMIHTQMMHTHTIHTHAHDKHTHTHTHSGNLKVDIANRRPDVPQQSGFTVVAEKLNWLRYISHFRRYVRPPPPQQATHKDKEKHPHTPPHTLPPPPSIQNSVHRGAYFNDSRTSSVRKLLPEGWGFLCPVHTPDGAPCGLLNHLAAPCQIVTYPTHDVEDAQVCVVCVWCGVEGGDGRVVVVFGVWWGCCEEVWMRGLLSLLPLFCLHTHATYIHAIHIQPTHTHATHTQYEHTFYHLLVQNTSITPQNPPHLSHTNTNTPPHTQSVTSSITRLLTHLGMQDASSLQPPPPAPHVLPILLDGVLVGRVLSSIAPRLVGALREIKAQLLAMEEGPEGGKGEGDQDGKGEGEGAAPLRVLTVGGGGW